MFGKLLGQRWIIALMHTCPFQDCHVIRTPLTQCLRVNFSDHQATPMKCLNMDDTSGQLKLEGWLYIVCFVYTLFHWPSLGGTILCAIQERRHHFIGNFGEEGTTLLASSGKRHHFIGYIWEKVGGTFLFLSKTMLEVGWIFILWSMLYLEGWSSYFIGMALLYYNYKLYNALIQT